MSVLFTIFIQLMKPRLFLLCYTVMSFRFLDLFQVNLHIWRNLRYCLLTLFDYSFAHTLVYFAKYEERQISNLLFFSFFNKFLLSESILLVEL